MSSEPATPVIAWFQRDASFWTSPNTTTVKRVHIRHPTKRSRFGHRRALCGDIPLLDDEDSGEFPEPPETMKCKRCLRSL